MPPTNPPCAGKSQPANALPKQQASVLPEAQESLSAFQSVLSRMFQLDGAENLQLDFGIYRVINLKAQFIQKELINKLPKMVNGILATFGDEDCDTVGWKKSDYVKDGDFIKSEIGKIAKSAPQAALTNIYVNGANANYDSLTPLFQKLMFLEGE